MPSRALESPFTQEDLWEREGEPAALRLLESETPFAQAYEGDRAQQQLQESEYPPAGEAEEEWDSEEFYNERAPDAFFGEEEERELDRKASRPKSQLRYPPRSRRRPRGSARARSPQPAFARRRR
jgi:hypothetical protein